MKKVIAIVAMATLAACGGSSPKSYPTDTTNASLTQDTAAGAPVAIPDSSETTTPTRPAKEESEKPFTNGIK